MILPDGQIAWRDRDSGPTGLVMVSDQLCRVVRIGLLVYLAPVLLLILVMGTLGMAIEWVGRFRRGPSGTVVAGPAYLLVDQGEPRKRLARHRRSMV